MLILITPTMKRKWKKMGNLRRKESIHLLQQIFNEYFTCIPVFNTEDKEVYKMKNILLLMVEENKQTTIEIEKCHSILGQLK